MDDPGDALIKLAAPNYVGCAACKVAKRVYLALCSISRCALLNAPAGSFSKDIDEVESYRVIVTRHPLARFGEENDDRYC
jgi:hypothetical protein